MSKRSSNQDLLNGLKKQLQKVLFDQQKLLHDLEVNNLIPEYDAEKSLIFDSKTVPEMKSVLQGEYAKLEKFDVVLAVVGTMKAGKSTTINAIAGQEILPNRNRPMTSLPTLIAHKRNQKEPILACDVKAINTYISKLNKLQLSKYSEDERVSSYKEILALLRNIQKGYKFKQNYEGEKAIFSFLADLNDLVRLSRIIAIDYPKLSFPFSAYKEINSLPRIEVEFTELAQQDEQLGNLVLLDTPGPNEANLPELKEIFEQQLKRSSAVMVVMDYTQLKSQADADIREELDKLPKIEKDRLFVLVNKFDQKNSNGDDETTTKSIVAYDLLKDKIHLQNVYCISAQDAFLATRIQNHINLYQEKPDFDKTDWVQDFAKKAFGTRAKRMWEKSELDEIIEDSKALAIDSNMASPLTEIIKESYKKAPEIAMKSALKDVENIFTSINNYFSVHGYFSKEYQMTQEELNKIKDSLSRLETSKTVLKQHSDDSLTMVNSAKKKSNEESSKIFKRFKSDSSGLIEREVYKTIAEFTNKKTTDYKDVVGRSYIDKFIKILKHDEEYAKQKSELKVELEDLKNSSQGDVIKLEKDKMKELISIIDTKVLSLQKDFKQSLEEMLNSILESFNQTIVNVNKTTITDISRISKDFKNTGIDIKLSSLKIKFLSSQEEAKINFAELSKETKVDRLINSTSAFAGARRWFGEFFDKQWGLEIKEFTYIELSLNQVNESLKTILSSSVVEPLQQYLELNFKKFDDQIKVDLDRISLQVDELINELQAAYNAEQLPYEQKKKRKDAMSGIDNTNKSIQTEINLIKQQLPDVLAGALL